MSKINPFDKLRVRHSAELSRSHAEQSRSSKIFLHILAQILSPN